MVNIISKIKLLNLRLNKWSLSHFVGIAVFNIIMILLFLLYSAGYFKPFLPISINLIVVIGLILSILLLEVKSRAMFIICLFFWLFAAFLKIVKIDVWAERTTIYVYQSLVLGIVLTIVENIDIIKIKKNE